MSIVIREAADGDAAALASLSTQLGYPTDVATMRERLRRVQALRIGCVFVAVEGSAIVGWTHVVDCVRLEDAPLAEIAGLIVDETVRGSGIGALLVRAAKDWTRAHGYDRLRVRSNVMRERAHRFYVREGYLERKRQVVFEKVVIVG